MSNKVKFTSEVLESLFAELALGKGIKKALEARSLSWEGFRKLLHKKPKIRQEYEQAKQDGVDYLLSEATSQLESAIADFKLNGKGDLAISHLVKEAVALTKWKATHLLPKYSNKQQVKHSFNAETPLVVKWEKSQ